MDFQLTPEQEELRDAVRKLCSGRFPIARLRTLEGKGLDREIWGELDGFGVFSLGTDAEVADAAIVFEELGRALVPGPLVWSYLAGASGSVVGGVEATSGAAVVEHLGDLDSLVVLDDSGIRKLDPGSLDSRPLEPLDPLTPVWEVASAIAGGEQIGGPDDAARWRLVGATLVAAQLAGMSAALTELTVAYTSERRQFGRPVGSFQALKHLLADMLVRSELARTQAYAAACHLDETSLGDPARAVSAAKSVAGRAAKQNATASVQAHGGMGFTWEVDSHLYLKRAFVLDSLFGSADRHADFLAGVVAHV